MTTLRRLLMTSALSLAIALGVSGVASAHVFHTESSPTVIEGQTSKAVLDFGEARPVCKQASFQGEFSNLQTQITVHPSFSECSFGILVFQVIPNGCTFVLKGATSAKGHGLVELVCEAGKALEVRIPAIPCTAKFLSQTAESGATYTNEGSGTTRDLQVALTPTNMVYETIGSCTFGTGKDAAFTGLYTAKGFKAPSGPQVGIWIE